MSRNLLRHPAGGDALAQSVRVLAGVPGDSMALVVTAALQRES